MTLLALAIPGTGIVDNVTMDSRVFANALPENDDIWARSDPYLTLLLLGFDSIEVVGSFLTNLLFVSEVNSLSMAITARSEFKTVNHLNRITQIEF